MLSDCLNSLYRGGPGFRSEFCWFHMSFSKSFLGSVRRNVALARKHAGKSVAYLQFSELMQWQHYRIDKVHQERN